MEDNWYWTKYDMLPKRIFKKTGEVVEHAVHWMCWNSIECGIKEGLWRPVGNVVRDHVESEQFKHWEGRV